MRLKDNFKDAAELKAQVKKYMIETYERMDFVAETADGIYMYDENGVPYLDFYAGIAVNSLGNCNPKVVAAVIDQVQEIMHTFNYPYTVPQAVLSKEICEAAGMDKIIYQNSGSEANEAMIKMARKYGVDHYGPDHFEIITAKQSFHGRTLGAMTATGQPDSAIQKGFGTLPVGFKYAEYNNLKAFEEAIGPNTCAIMFEPVQGEGGVYPATDEFMQGIRKLCDEKGIMFLLDEVQAGFGRTGKFFTFQHYGIKPDLIPCGKGVSSSLPLSAVIGRRDIMDLYAPGSMTSPHSASPLCVAAALENFKIIQDEKLVEHAAEMGKILQPEIIRIQQKYPEHLTWAGGKGMVAGIRCTKGNKEPDPATSLKINLQCLYRGLLMFAPVGFGGECVKIAPPLTMKEDMLRESIAVLEEACDAVFAK